MPIKSIKFENKTTNRYFYIQIDKDLINDYMMVIRRGGQFKNVILKKGFSCWNALQKELDKIMKRRLQRGYSLVS